MTSRSAQSVSSGTMVPSAGARVVVRVGVTGHRMLPAEHLEAIEAVCRTVLETARSAATAIAMSGHTGYSAEAALVRVVTSLAEGSDQILAQAATELKGTDGAAVETWAILPFSTSVYCKDFEKPDGDTSSVDQFQNMLAAMDHCTALEGDRSDLPKRLAAYEQAGKLMLAGCDVLISICSPGAATRQGSSVQMTQEALTNGMPVVTIDPDNPKDVYLKWIDPDGGSRQERFDPHRFERSLREMLAPPKVRDREIGRSRWQAIQKEIISLPKPNLAEELLTKVYKLPWMLLRMFARSERKAAAPSVNRPITPLKEAYERAEELSQHYAMLWRGSFMFNYMLGATAVTCALLQYATQSEGLAWTWSEAIALLLLLINYWIGRLRYWHASFGDMRFFAEQLRQARAMSLIGAMLPQIHAADSESEQDRDAWINWYCRALQRSYLPPAADLDTKYAWTVAGWISKQQSYQEEYAASRLAMEDFLKKGEVVLFIFACLACALHLIGVLPKPMEPWILFVAAAAPAWAAVFHSISVEGEFKTIAEASESAAAQLKEISSEALRALKSGRASHAALILNAKKAARVMMNEATGWRSVSQMHQMLPS